MKWLRWLGLPVGIAILLAMTLKLELGGALHMIAQAGYALLLLIPLHALPLLLDAQGWRVLLDGRASLAFLWWVATVREAVNRLLPVAGIGGEVIGIRLAQWRVPDGSAVAASVIVEVVVTLAVQYVFSAIGVVLIVASSQRGDGWMAIVLGLVLSLPVPATVVVLMRRGGIFVTIERFAKRLFGASNPILQRIDGKRLDVDIDALMLRTGVLLRAFLWQLAGYVLGALETWLALKLLGHPVSVGGAVAIEAITQAVRHAAFFVPAGLGVQEAAVVLLARLFGVDHNAAISLALVKRMREVSFGCLSLLSWQCAEVWRRVDQHRASQRGADERSAEPRGAQQRSSDQHRAVERRADEPRVEGGGRAAAESVKPAKAVASER
jgi:putative membrane protein